MSTTTQTSSATQSSDYVPRGPAEASLTPPAGQPKYNYREQKVTVPLTDIRGNEAAYTLDKDSFSAHSNVPSAATYSTFDSDDTIRSVYYPEVTQFLLDKVPGAHKVILFDHTIRRQKEGSARTPVSRAHVDQTPRAAADRVRLHVSDPKEAEALLAGRYRIINVWRPLGPEPVQSFPLAFASAASVQESDLVPVQHRYPNRVGETMGVQYNPGQKWNYWSGMTGDERLLLKCSDSKGLADGSVAQWVPHTAFEDARTPAGARPRESIEVRALVFG
ncbi:hypothetical protein N7468_004694 [Penicillium chermesinum]|uniref:Methyltransferase n=1 Tax=Penicillium chermesinum TaxID=63820 RepID=A0A9W9P992_9EURO|nr:uncharacterized protein N7468_004694 [Penicillium chermesinum]KAJ5240075.1 hypothetical protein N7468_004694 [Penicillium chermesinum]